MVPPTRDSQFLLQFAEQPLSSPDITRSAQADLDVVAPLGDHGEEGIKSHHPGHLAEGDIQAIGDPLLYPAG